MRLSLTHTLLSVPPHHHPSCDALLLPSHPFPWVLFMRAPSVFGRVARVQLCHHVLLCFIPHTCSFNRSSAPSLSSPVYNNALTLRRIMVPHHPSHICTRPTTLRTPHSRPVACTHSPIEPSAFDTPFTFTSTPTTPTLLILRPSPPPSSSDALTPFMPPCLRRCFIADSLLLMTLFAAYRSVLW